MRGHEADFVTSPKDIEVLNGSETGRCRGHGKGSNSSALTTVEITPVKAPSDIKSAIRRQKRTETLDYIWQALPISRTARPLYRAVLRGSLHPGNSVQYSITSINGGHTTNHTLRPSGEQRMVLRDESLSSQQLSGNPRNNYHNQTVVQPGLGSLRVAGVGLNDIKNHQDMATSGQVPPGVRQGQTPPLYVSRHMKPSFLLDQRASTNGFSSKSKKNDDYIDDDKDREASQEEVAIDLKTTNKSSSGSPFSPRSAPGTLYNKSRRITPFKGVEGALSPSSQASQSLGNNINTSSDSNENSNSAIKTNVDTSIKMKDKTLSNLTTNTTTVGNTPNPTDLAVSITSKTGCDVDKPIRVEIPNGSSSEQYGQHDLAGDVTSVVKKSSDDVSISPRNPNPSATSPRELSCIQLADSILGAVNGDLSQVYSLCKSKLRYSDFIEQSQPHRLLGKPQGNGIGFSILKPAEHHTNPSETLATKETAQVQAKAEKAKPPQGSGNGDSPRTSMTSGDKETGTAMPRLPMIKATQKSLGHLKAPTHSHTLKKNPRGGETGVRDSDSHNRSTQTTNDSTTTPVILEKSVRPILKTFKAELAETVGVNDKDDDNNNNNYNISHRSAAVATTRSNSMANNNVATGNGSNRLVRFNTCHEVREFTPSEPIRQQ